MVLPEQAETTAPIAFGPVPSRRLGRSLGINNVPRKTCDYSCIYCQVGPTHGRTTGRRSFYGTGRTAGAVEAHVAAVRARGHAIDWLTFVPDGEPTLDTDLGAEIMRLKGLGIPLAVITNGSLLWDAGVREALAAADHVSVKLDVPDAEHWRRVNRPAETLDFDTVLDGMRAFAAGYRGRLETETMLVRGINDAPEIVRAAARLVDALKPVTAWLGVPSRPTAEAGCVPPDREAYRAAFAAFSGVLPQARALTGLGEGGYGDTGDVVADLLAITAVHPMTEEDVRAFIDHAAAGAELIGDLVEAGRLVQVRHEGRTFYRAGEGKDAMTDSNDETPAVDMARAFDDPAGLFGTPEAVADHAALTAEQKAEILRRWEYDAAEACVAGEEGMPGGETSDLLHRVLVCLDRVAGGYDAGRTAPTKQNGLTRASLKRR